MRVGALNIVLSFYSFFLSIFYVPVFFNGATNTRWIWLALTTPILILCLEKQKFTLLHFIGLLFLLLSCISLNWTFNLYDSIEALIKLLIIAQVFVLGSKLKDLKPIFIGLAIGITISNFNLPSGLFVNKSMLGEAALLTIIGLFIYNIKWLIVPVVPAAVLSGSRGVIVGFLSVLVAYTWNKNKPISILLIVLILSFVSASFALNIGVGSIKERLDMWVDSFKAFSFWGNGIGSFHAAFPYYSDNIDTLKYRPTYAHNDLIQIMFEIGVFGLILAITFATALLKTNSNEKYIIIAFLVMAQFSFPFYMPVSVFIFTLVAGHMSRNWNCLFSEAPTGRVLRMEGV